LFLIFNFIVGIKGVKDTDLLYLSNSSHNQVEHLDLSENRLTQFTEALISLLKKCSASLIALELDDNRFDCIDYLTIICVVRKMDKLRILGTKGTFEINDHLLAAEFLNHSVSMCAWRISYPINVYDTNANDTNVIAQDRRKKVFNDKIDNIIKNKFKLVLSELFL
jgi:hypothetical protein